MKKDLKLVYVSCLPRCDFCSEQASFDGKTKMGPWANMCQSDFDRYGIGLGLGLGQKLEVRTEAVCATE